MKRDVLRGSVALILALIGGLAQGSLPARAALASPNLYLVQAQHLTTMLAPGATIQIVARDLPPAPHGYCLGLVSLRDRYGIPVSLGAFHRTGTRTWTVVARVPRNVFPAEPAGPFLLYAGRCTSVAPDGNFGSTQVTIMPSAV
jgi:hypothetical protein